MGLVIVGGYSTEHRTGNHKVVISESFQAEAEAGLCRFV